MFYMKEYPYDVWVSIHLFKDKLLNYKIGSSKRSAGSCGLWFTDELRDNFDEVQELYYKVTINGEGEHSKAFDNASEIIKKFKDLYGYYYDGLI